jgi:hypothetical protein
VVGDFRLRGLTHATQRGICTLEHLGACREPWAKQSVAVSGGIDACVIVVRVHGLQEGKFSSLHTWGPEKQHLK